MCELLFNGNPDSRPPPVARRPGTQRRPANRPSGRRLPVPGGDGDGGDASDCDGDGRTLKGDSHDPGTCSRSSRRQERAAAHDSVSALCGRCCRRPGRAISARPLACPCPDRRLPILIPPFEPARTPPRAMSSSPETKLAKAVKTYPFWSVHACRLVGGRPERLSARASDEASATLPSHWLPKPISLELSADHRLCRSLPAPLSGPEVSRPAKIFRPGGGDLPSRVRAGRPADPDARSPFFVSSLPPPRRLVPGAAASSRSPLSSSEHLQQHY
jgi:hypothetical protein